jgi:hypothetical protein
MTLRRVLLGVAIAIAAGASVAYSQRGGYYRRMSAPLATPESFDGGFNFCRVMFRTNPYGDGSGWGVDFPRADVNLSIRLSEITKTTVSRDEAGEPRHLLLRLTDKELFHCPFIMMTEPGAAYLGDEEVKPLRAYLEKGGFLWVDDFWGSYSWEAWVRTISRVLPPSEYPIADLKPDHPLYRTLFEVKHVPQIPSIQFWMGSGGETSERGSDSAEPELKAISDRAGRVMVLMTHNTDIGDAFEREGDDPDFFYRFSVDGYAMGINILVYAMTH